MKVKGKIGGAPVSYNVSVVDGKATIDVHVGNLTVSILNGNGPGAVRTVTSQAGKSLDVDHYTVPVATGGKVKAGGTKANPASPARASRGKNDNPEYTHYVVTANGQINSGWWYASDAKDVLKEEKENGYPIIGTGARVLARVTLVRMGKDPKVNTNWQFKA